MRIFLQHAETGYYLTTLGLWAVDIEEGHDFQHSQAALEYVGNHSLNDVHLVVNFPDGESVVLPLPVAITPGEPAAV